MVIVIYDVRFCREKYQGRLIKVYIKSNGKFFTNITGNKTFEWTWLALDAAKEKIYLDLLKEELMLLQKYKKSIEKKRINAEKEKIKKDREHKKTKRVKRKFGDHYFCADGYISILKKEHPFANKNRCIFEHRVVMEQWLREHEPNHPALIEIDGIKYLRREYIVHHRNWVRDDNRVENLLVVKNTDHRKEQTYKKFQEFLEQDPVSVLKVRENYAKKRHKRSKK